MSETRYQSWGRLPISPQRAVKIGARDALLPKPDAAGTRFLPFGNGRSYGDSCLNEDGVLLDCRGLNQLIGFDKSRGLLRCEAGMLLSEILETIVPAGWFLPVTPGTKFITVGGAIANDVHGKNHHVRGTFGRHVTRLELLRSDGQRFECTRQENVGWLRSTIGGLGLTGLITWAEIQLIPIRGTGIDQEVIRFGSLGEFYSLTRDSDKEFEYSVAWVDSLAAGKALGRGLFIRGNHSAQPMKQGRPRPQPRFTVPFQPPVPLINRVSLKLFNTFYYRKQLGERQRKTVHYEPFFYPLDAIGAWNRLYGPKGLLQHQCVVPMSGGVEAVGEMLARTQRAHIGSFLTVLKAFGNQPSPGLLSFPCPGLTLTLDFANGGARTYRLLQELDEVVRQAGGRVAPYKDARMSAESYQTFFPHWRELVPFIDPAFSSSFWRRVTEGAPGTSGDERLKPGTLTGTLS